MTHRIPGRHRAPSRLTAAGTTISRSAKTTAVVATSGGLLATVVAPASANPQGIVDEVASVVSGNITAAPAVDLLAANMPIMAEPTDLPAVAVAAPDDVETDFGSLGFTGVTPVVEEPEPVVEEPEPVVEAAPAETTESTGSSTTETFSSNDSTSTNERSNEGASRDTTREAAPVAPPSNGGVIGIAASYVGYPYVYGGGSPSGFDCSGYTSYVFAQVGKSLPRSAAAQQAYATPVSNPQPGDLVFWGYPAYHVGIYAGNGMVYDAGNPGVGVTYRSVFSGVSGYGRV